MELHAGHIAARDGRGEPLAVRHIGRDVGRVRRAVEIGAERRASDQDRLAVFSSSFLIGWGVFNMLECVARHDIVNEWLIFATGLGFVLLGGILIWTRIETVIERRSGYDRRSASPLR